MCTAQTFKLVEDTARCDTGLDEAKATVVGTDIIASLTGRPAAKVSKHFIGLDIDWSFAELEMERWADQLRPHQGIKIDLVVNLETKQSTVAVVNESGTSTSSFSAISILGSQRPSRFHLVKP